MLASYITNLTPINSSGIALFLGWERSKLDWKDENGL